MFRTKLEHIDFQNLVAGREIQVVAHDEESGSGRTIRMILSDIGYDTMLVEVQRPLIELIEKNRLLDQDVLMKILDRMEQFGGSFVQQLAAMTRRADAQNRVKCLLMWTKYFMDYLEEK